MRLRTALNDYKRRAGRFPEEARTVEGALSGHGDRLVHVSPSGALRDHSGPVSGLGGIDRSRLGVETAEHTYWFDDLDVIRQHYYRETRLVETEFDAGEFTVHQFDLTLGRSHVTHVELRGAVPADAELVAFLTLAPEGRESGVGALVHEAGGPDGAGALEVYRRREADYVTASTGLDAVWAQRPERLREVLDGHVEFPRTGVDRHSETRLTGDFVVRAPFERAGRATRATLGTRLTEREEEDREAALAALAECVGAHSDAGSLRDAALARAPVAVPEGVPRRSLVRSDIRAVGLLEGAAGGHVAGPEFDGFFENSGGYGYVWFRDDAELSRHLLAAADRLEVDPGADFARTAELYCETQLPDGSWPHRVWASDGSLAPGWANGRLERGGDAAEHQADQTASAVAFLATLLRERPGALSAELRERIEAAVADGVAALDEILADDGLPERCQNVWENAVGRFAHTAAAYLDAYAAVARAPVDGALSGDARASAAAVLEGLDALWLPEEEHYATALIEGNPDGRLDAGTLHLATAVRACDAAEGIAVGERTVDRLAAHVRATLDGLHREAEESEVAGLVRYEGDRWRTAGQAEPKVWSLATGLGAFAAARFAALLADRGRAEAADEFAERAGDLYALLDGDGPLATDAGYLAEQAFDDGTLDSAAPLGWAHGLRLHATALLADLDALPAPARETTGPTDRPRWTTGRKLGFATAADHGEDDPSRVWFTLTEGALTEVRFPRIDVMNVRTLDYLVRCPADGYTARTHAERGEADDGVERRVEPAADDALLFRQVFAGAGNGRDHDWRLEVEYATDPDHDAVVANVAFEAGDDREYEVFAVADTALANTADRDRALRVGEAGRYNLLARDPTAYTGETADPLLVDADGDGYSVAMALSAADGFDWATVGVAGSDRVAGLFAGERLPEPRSSVDDENAVLIGRLGTGPRVETALAAGFARRANTAAALGEANAVLGEEYDAVRAAYVRTWSEFLADRELPSSVADDPDLANQYRSALMCLLAVEDKTYHGASIASPSVPWGEAVAADEPKGYGYNFVWARDLYQVFSVFRSVGMLDVATQQLEYIYEYQQDERGFIPQNTYVNGTTRWGGEQMDNISFPAVMAYQLWEAGVGFEAAGYGYEHVRRSADYVARNGPATVQERWEEESGYSPSSIAAEVAGLACAGKLAVEAGETADALAWLALADGWVAGVEEWTATRTGTARHERTPYYCRVVRDGEPDAGHLRTLANDGPTLDERDIIDAGFLELVRLGIVPPEDGVIGNSVGEADETIRVGVGSAAGFYRYNGDGYGERQVGDKGGPWSVENNGKGRLWPLLTGERGEYELLAGGDHAGDPLDPADCLRAMQEFANAGRMIPEQVWDREHGTDYDWELGEGTGSATPLAWSMAQYCRLAHGLEAGEPVETPAFVRERYRERGLADPDRGPALRTDTHFRGDELVVSGETSGAAVAVKTPAGATLVRPDGDRFEATVDVEPGGNQVVVAAADDEDLETAATTVERLSL